MKHETWEYLFLGLSVALSFMILFTQAGNIVVDKNDLDLRFANAEKVMKDNVWTAQNDNDLLYESRGEHGRDIRAIEESMKAFRIPPSIVQNNYVGNAYCVVNQENETIRLSCKRMTR